MTKEEAIKMIDEHKNKLIDPVDMLYWTALRVIILQIDDLSWNTAVRKADSIMRS